jgi:hypothetical protein
VAELGRERNDDSLAILFKLLYGHCQIIVKTELSLDDPRIDLHMIVGKHSNCNCIAALTCMCGTIKMFRVRSTASMKQVSFFLSQRTRAITRLYASYMFLDIL